MLVKELIERLKRMPQDVPVCAEGKLADAVVMELCNGNVYVRIFKALDYEKEGMIKALEQEPCEDCISRAAVINAIYATSVKDNQYNLTAKHIKDAVEKLPSVQPKRIKAKWNPLEYDGYADGYPVWDKWECSKCGEEHEGEQDTLTQFCPNCGSEMEVNE